MSHKRAIKAAAKGSGSLLAGQADVDLTKINADLLVFNFKYLDHTQGQTLEHWENSRWLAKAMDTLKGYSGRTVNEALSDPGKKFTCYGEIPSNSHFKRPKNVPSDAKWTRIHVQGLQCVIGHIVRNVFYVVFLDGEHKFWPSKKR